ncbi:MAG: DUF4082 domain-containing protein, partial [Actinomycetota bacterium]|nr:DUF4082 domain-containing protein [Actinomycetota bacterium]
SVNATVTGLRFYKAATNTGIHVGSLWSPGGGRLATGTFTGEAASGWQTLTFAQPVQIRSGQPYVVSYSAPKGRYSVDPAYFNGKGAGIVPLTAPATGSVYGGNGVYRYGAGFPDSTFNGGNYWVDAIVTTGTADNTAPVVNSVSPAAGSAGAYTDSTITATFNEGVDPGSVQFIVQAGGNPIAGTVDVDDKTVSFTAADLLPANTAHSVSVSATDGFGNPLAAPKTWNFTTGTNLGPCPCNLFKSRTPALLSANDTSDVELGVKFSVVVNATATGVRFFKASNNTGTHTGSLWTETGQRIAHGTFTNESESGWQSMTFASPTQIQAGETYIVSYRAPNGHYAVDAGYFAAQGAGRGVLTAPSSPAAGGQGVYLYGGGFPANSFNANNYSVDITVDTDGADNTAPTVIATDPAANATGVSTGAGVTASFSEPVNRTSLQMSVTRGDGVQVPGTLRIAADNRSVMFVSTDLLPGNTQLTASVLASDVMGNPMPAAKTWTFTTAAAGACPCGIFRPTDVPAASGVETPLELGMRVTVAQNGWITGVRFHKPIGDPGSHTGTLWTANGVQLATGTFTDETSSGWQTLTFATPVRVTAGTTYVVSYFTSAGRYSYTSQYFTEDRVNGPLTAPAQGALPNGVFNYGGGVFPQGNGNGRNYWVDALFVTTLP